MRLLYVMVFYDYTCGHLKKNKVEAPPRSVLIGPQCSHRGRDALVTVEGSLEKAHSPHLKRPTASFSRLQQVQGSRILRRASFLPSYLHIRDIRLVVCVYKKSTSSQHVEALRVYEETDFWLLCIRAQLKKKRNRTC